VATKTTPTATPATETAPERPACLCGCGGFPKGKNARFIPGHDARFHAAEKRAAAEAAGAVAAPAKAPKAPKVAAAPKAKAPTAKERLTSKAPATARAMGTGPVARA
jgi:hypothetical protein